MDYWLAIDALKAQESLDDINVACMPHSKKENRQKIMRELKRRITMTIKKSGNRLKSIGDIYQDLARKLNG